MVPTPAPMIFDALKAETRQQHSQLEQLNGLPRSIADYTRFLEKLWGFVLPWEARLAEMLPASDPLRAGREKSGWLRADLYALGHTPPSLDSLPCCEALPATPTRLHLLGGCYVIEGSTLGGQIIGRHIVVALGLESGRCDRYVRSYGPQTGAQWQAFRAELARHSSAENDPVIIGAARDTFSALADWFAACAAVRP